MTSTTTIPTGTTGTVGTQRSTGTCFLLTIVTLGIYPVFYNYGVHKEMKEHSGTGIGGGIALLISLLFGIAMPFITSGEVEGLYKRAGRPSPVSAATGAWILLPLAGVIIWFVKTNKALNEYWAAPAA